jgi:Cytosol aminopeptidase family, catalytic domain
VPVEDVDLEQQCHTVLPLRILHLDIPSHLSFLIEPLTTPRHTTQHHTILYHTYIGVKGNYHALMCIAENAIGPIATRPDDVHTLLSGKTVEVRGLHDLKHWTTSGEE